jgi:starch synthase (maltosyl-transferring)
VLAALSFRPIASLVTHSSEFTLHVEPRHAGVGSWYEFFPRSEGALVTKDSTYKSGTFASATKRLPAVADMGFDVLYLPPVHPIGRIGRKGPNNTLTPGPGDPGSPWAIGSSDGGHDSVHPDLGTMADFEKFVKAANKLGLDVALDLALQAAPDHPWVAEHPEWFTTLPDGTIAYAENPPKKYQDIYPVNFDNDPQGIRDEVLRIVRLWISKGVRIFRVDNPHTKPVDFWEWLIGTVNAERPDVVFLAEAFTRPAMMQTLAKIGFQQSYSYFTWRNTKPELEEFFTSISHETAAWYRPNLFVNTPDILTEYLQFGGPAAFTIRATLAATAAPLWGVYAGFELFESVARPGAEEYIDNEKYEYKPRDWDAHAAAGTTLAPYLAQLNAVRAAHPALQQLRNLDVHWSDDDHVLVYTKHLDAAFTATGAADSLIIVVNTDPHSVRETTVHLDLTRLGLNPDARIKVTDTITGAVFEWSRDNFVRLDPFTQPAHILHVTEVR